MSGARPIALGGAWTPPMSGGLIGWWRADGGLSLDGSNRAQQWDNRVSPSGGASFLEDPAAGPSSSWNYQGTGWNSNRPTLSITTPTKWLRNATNSQILGFGAAGAKRTIACVIGPSSTAANKFLFQWWNGTFYYVLYFAASSQNLVIDMSDGIANGSPVNTGVSFTGLCTLVATRNGDNHVIYKDGVQVATASVPVAVTSPTEFLLGASAIGGGTEGFVGLCPEVCLWTDTHPSLASRFHAYARNRWGGLP